MSRWIKNSLICLAIIIVGTSTVFLWYKNEINKTYDFSKSHTVIIVQGESAREVVSYLVSHNLLNNYWATIIYIKTKHIILMPGTFIVPTRYNLKDLFKELGQEAFNQQKLVIPDGWNRQQIADTLPKFGLSPSIFLSLTENDEGELFPDTYYVDSHTTEKSLVAEMLANYQSKISGLTVSYDNLILASIVEREAKDDSQRQIIAGIYLNRLKQGMKLDADPTVQYAKYTDLGFAPLANGQKNYWAPITASDYSTVYSAYNTYLYSGLPPTPICNPGIKSIEDVLHPTSTTALYFITTPSGKLITSQTLAGQQENERLYLSQ